MDEHTFKKLAEILRPMLECNEYYTSEKRERQGFEGSRRISCLFPVVQQYNLSAMKRIITFPAARQCVHNWPTL